MKCKDFILFLSSLDVFSTTKLFDLKIKNIVIKLLKILFGYKYFCCLFFNNKFKPNEIFKIIETN